MITETKVETCVSCGSAVEGNLLECEDCRFKRENPIKKRVNPVFKLVGGIVATVVAVVAAWALMTFVPYFMNGSSAGPAPKSHLQVSTGVLQGTATAGIDNAIAYAVADVEGNSQKDRESLNGKSVSVTGYVVASSNNEVTIADDASAPAGSPRLIIHSAAPGFRAGEKGRFTGVYDSTSNTLKAMTSQVTN